MQLKLFITKFKKLQFLDIQLFHLHLITKFIQHNYISTCFFFSFFYALPTGPLNPIKYYHLSGLNATINF